jgi:DNA-binding PadR family transcriptional regulator
MRHFFHRLHEFHATRHGGRHHHGFFGFGADFGEGFPGRGGRGAGRFGPGRKLGSADLQLLLLALLAEKASHGYELIKALDERSNGYYTPSPGMVYPALTYLEEIGLATVQADGTKKLYSITEAGLTHIEKNRQAVDTMLQQLQWIGRKMDHLRRAMSGEAGAEHEASDFDSLHEDHEHHGHHGHHDHREGRREGSRGESPDLAPEIRMAKRQLKSALIEKIGSGHDEQRRIAEILERAAAEIRGA